MVGVGDPFFFSRIFMRMGNCSGACAESLFSAASSQFHRSIVGILRYPCSFDQELSYSTTCQGHIFELFKQPSTYSASPAGSFNQCSKLFFLMRNTAISVARYPALIYCIFVNTVCPAGHFWFRARIQRANGGLPYAVSTCLTMT